MKSYFDHEKLDVYREAITFVGWLSGIFENTPRIGDVKDQLDRASTSIVLNIAEGNGKYNSKDRCRFFDIAHTAQRSNVPPVWMSLWRKQKHHLNEFVPARSDFKELSEC